MDFWNIAVPTIIFLAPTLAIVLLGLRKANSGATEYNGVAVAFGIGLLASLVGVARFDQAVRLELLLPLSTEPSGYFEFAFQLQWMRFLWIAFSAALLLSFSLLDRPSAGATGDEGRPRNLSFLLGAFFFSALAFLSENTLLSLMFAEVTAFLLYAFGVRADGQEGELEKISYFKRSSFIFLSLLAMLGLAATGQFSVNSITLLGLVLYSLSFLFSKHTFPAWRYSPLVVLQAGILFFLLGRIMKEGMSPELWVPLAGTFGLGAVFLSAYAIRALSNLGTAFWTVFAFVCYLFFLRFSSGRPDDQFWGAYEVVGLASAYALAQLFRFGRLADQPWKKALHFIFAGLMLAVVTGALPGADAAITRGVNDPVRLVAYGVVTFFISLIVGKGLTVSFAPASGDAEKGQTYWKGLVPAAVALLAQLGTMARIIDIYGENPYRMGISYVMGSPLVIVAASALLVGLLAGALLGANSRYLGWAKVKERRMEDLFPRIDPSLIHWNEVLARSPDRLLRWSGAKASAIAERAAGKIDDGDRAFFGDRLYRGFRQYGSSLSLLLRFFHSGSVRAYLFMGILVTLFSCMLFLLEGR